MSGVKRWRIINPNDSNAATREYRFPQNPEKMTSPYPKKSVTSSGTPRGRILLWQGGTGAQQWSFSGPILNKKHLDDLAHWVYDIRNRLVIEDHYGRYIGVYLTDLDAVPRRRVNRYYSHEYTVNAMVLTLRYGGDQVPDKNSLGYLTDEDEEYFG